MKEEKLEMVGSYRVIRNGKYVEDEEDFFSEADYSVIYDDELGDTESNTNNIKTWLQTLTRPRLKDYGIDAKYELVPVLTEYCDSESIKYFSHFPLAWTAIYEVKSIGTDNNDSDIIFESTIMSTGVTPADALASLSFLYGKLLGKYNIGDDNSGN